MDNVTLLKGLSDAFGRGDIPTVLGANLFMKLGADFDGFAVHPKSVHGAGDSVIVEARYSGTYKATGKSMDTQVCHVWDVKDGKLTRFQQSSTPPSSRRSWEPRSNCDAGISMGAASQTQAGRARRDSVMGPTLASIQPFTVAGLSVRTVNRDEADPARARLPGLWDRFYGQQVRDTIPNRQADSLVYGVYADYESDASGPYTVTAGVRVTAPTPEHRSVAVRGGQYLVFETHGAMPQAVIDCWGTVWRYFAQSRNHRRLFATDYEEYRGPDRVAIFISVAEAGA
jgi:predicted transcriptional regulator YdeE